MRVGGRQGPIQLGIAIAAGIAAWCVAPDLATPARHREFTDFFLAAAATIAALLIALAVEARSVIGGPFFANVTMGSLAVGEIGAVAALSPSLPSWMYQWLFALTVAGGVGGLVAVVAAGRLLLEKDIAEARETELDALKKRREADRERQEEGDGGSAAG
jgi:hypothetical protein